MVVNNVALAGIETECDGVTIYCRAKDRQPMHGFRRELRKLVQSETDGYPVARTCKDRAEVSSRAAK